MATAQPISLRASTCRFCGTPLEHGFIDLGAQPLSNSLLRHADLNRMEAYYPLSANICGACKLVQLEDYQASEALLSDYACFSSHSESRLYHAETYCAGMIERFGFGPYSRVIEVASNDGYLLQYFARRGIPVLGIEPATNVARIAEQRGVPTRIGFFGRQLARGLVEDGDGADLLVANDVLAQVSDLNDFVAALRIALNPEGVLTLEFPHLLPLLEDTRIDRIGHERFSYFSFTVAERVFAAHGLMLFDVEMLPGLGDSLRIYGCHADAGHRIEDSVEILREREAAAGLDRDETYDEFCERALRAKRKLVAFLIEAKDAGKSIAAWGGSPASSSLLNVCGLGPDLIDFVVDANRHRQGLYLPRSHIPIAAPEQVVEARPDYLLILAPDEADRIVAANARIREWGGQFVMPLPEPRFVS